MLEAMSSSQRQKEQVETEGKCDKMSDEIKAMPQCKLKVNLRCPHFIWKTQALSKNDIIIELK